MNLSLTEFPSEKEMATHTDTVAMVLETTASFREENAVVTDFTADIPDSGMTLSFSGDSATSTGGYRDQFPSAIGYTKPQVDTLTKPEQVFASGWGEVPEPDDTANIFFLFKFEPPGVLTKTVTYTVTGTYDYIAITPVAPTVPPTVPAPAPVESPPESKTFTGTVTKEVTYDLDANVSEFERYV